ncbi:hypothetical protein PTSG_06598 [Salpingoeca rosetta]|uniref:Uncharacterized protein n=1 Tax=Salpingoeca rosetta (strain ATCC 50818 / BSB-021) TaxID=946362 RepID=F2UFF9_SALR5|nr:uncharacterized protein PTSG_06598 [Salpingoeca rosetta]EGD75527.1 hypothetical protein PTSG_06598 [Salpingoeca rosetta]|eukprot:XP_004991984.1 hypothetical protein PTSG_06598 [Salpingoeca rosetta]
MRRPRALVCVCLLALAACLLLPTCQAGTISIRLIKATLKMGSTKRPPQQVQFKVLGYGGRLTFRRSNAGTYEWQTFPETDFDASPRIHVFIKDSDWSLWQRQAQKGHLGSKRFHFTKGNCSQQVAEGKESRTVSSSTAKVFYVIRYSPNAIANLVHLYILTFGCVVQTKDTAHHHRILDEFVVIYVNVHLKYKYKFNLNLNLNLNLNININLNFNLHKHQHKHIDVIIHVNILLFVLLNSNNNGDNSFNKFLPHHAELKLSATINNHERTAAFCCFLKRWLHHNHRVAVLVTLTLFLVKRTRRKPTPATAAGAADASGLVGHAATVAPVVNPLFVPRAESFRHDDAEGNSSMYHGARGAWMNGANSDDDDVRGDKGHGDAVLRAHGHAAASNTAPLWLPPAAHGGSSHQPFATGSTDVDDECDYDDVTLGGMPLPPPRPPRRPQTTHHQAQQQQAYVVMAPRAHHPQHAGDHNGVHSPRQHHRQQQQQQQHEPVVVAPNPVYNHLAPTVDLTPDYEALAEPHQRPPVLTADSDINVYNHLATNHESSSSSI